MDLLAHLEEPKYPENVDASEIRNERKDMWGRIYDKYEERSKRCVTSINLDDSGEYYENYPHIEKELVENPCTKTFRKFLKNHGDLIDELTTVAGEPTEDEEELLLSGSESEDDCEDFIDMIYDGDSSQMSKRTVGVKADNSDHNKDYDKINLADESKNTENKIQPVNYSNDVDDENDLIYSAVKSKHSSSDLWIPSSSSFYDDKPGVSGEKLSKMSDAFETSRSEKNLEKTVSLENSLNNKDDPTSKEELLDKNGSQSISDYLCRLTCTGCGREVTTVLNIEDSAMFKCDDCWLQYDHGCDDGGCQECREIGIWVQTRREVFRRISRGDLEKEDDSEDGGEGDKDAPEGVGYEDTDDSEGAEDDDIDDPKGGEYEDSSRRDDEGLTCVECGVVTQVPVVMEDSFSFHCDECLLGYQHGCDINQDCKQCREIVIFVQARREVSIKLREGLGEDRGEKSKEPEINDLEPLGDSLGSLSLEDVDEDMSIGSTADECEADKNSEIVRSDYSDEVVGSTTGTIIEDLKTEEENRMDTTEVVTKDVLSDIEDTVPVERKASKNKMTPAQLEILVPFFAEYPRPTSDQKLQLALRTGLTKQVIQRWFGNRRRYK